MKKGTPRSRLNDDIEQLVTAAYERGDIPADVPRVVAIRRLDETDRRRIKRLKAELRRSRASEIRQ
ncbi:MAG: hypothetical protein WDN10_05280 [bacterium]